MNTWRRPLRVARYSSYAADVFGRLAAEDGLRGLNREQFIGRVAEFLADINALHPFREGNGRAQRAFFSQLVHEPGPDPVAYSTETQRP